MINIVRFSSFLFFFGVSVFASAHTIQFSGRVVDGATIARNNCLSHAIQYDKERTCRSETGTVVFTTIKHALVKYKGELTNARIVTINYK
ncbi:hypothetical protein [Pseudocitrobacter cyperus]|uniref:Type 1 fimbrial protein n=1 Tax=Pseudocitrobacter cyperus TaxID=3112843 RepID=A0ABV0HPH3_9ENTR